MFKLLFVTKYIDHILYFFLDRLRQQVDLSIVVDQANDWTQQLTADRVRLVHLAPKSKFDRDYKNSLTELGDPAGFDLLQCFHGNGELANVIQWNRRRCPQP